MTEVSTTGTVDAVTTGQAVPPAGQQPTGIFGHGCCLTVIREKQKQAVVARLRRRWQNYAGSDGSAT